MNFFVEYVVSETWHGEITTPEKIITQNELNKYFNYEYNIYEITDNNDFFTAKTYDELRFRPDWIAAHPEFQDFEDEMIGQYRNKKK